MIHMPRRSVTRFFIPLIDVLTLLFCIFLLMPMSGLLLPAEETGDAATVADPATTTFSAAERRELERLRREKQQWLDLESLRTERKVLEQLLEQLRHDRLEALQQRFVVRTLQIENDGRLVWYDPRREKDRLVEITSQNVGQFIAEQQRAAGDRELYVLLLYPRPAEGIPTFPLRWQREQYDNWFRNVPHGYDIPVQTP
jgi:hypothetical protein